MESNKITFKGENLMELRPDVDENSMLIYILAFYRILTPDFLYNNLKTMSISNIEKLYPAKINKIQHNTNTELSRYKSGAAIPFDYQKLKEKNAYEKPQAGRMLACLVLSKSYLNHFLPYDPFEAKYFFDENFKGNVDDVLHRYCVLRDVNEDELLAYYRNIAESNLTRSLGVKNEPKKHSTLDMLTATFLQLTK